MRKILTFLFALIISTPSLAVDNTVTLTPGAGVTMRTQDVGAGIQSPYNILGNTAGTSIYGTAGTANASVLTVQGIASGTTIPVSLTSTTITGTVAATQSGTWTVQPGNTANSTPWLVTGSGTAGTAATGVLTIQGIASMTKLLVTPDSVALPANQSVNISQINAVTPLMGNGVTGTGSLRVTVASDNTAFTVNAAQSGTWTVQPGNTANSTAWLVTGTGGTFPVTATNLSTNVAQINAVTPLMGNGVTGTGSLRVTIASDNTAFTVNAAQSGTWNIGTVTTVTNLAQMNGAALLMGNGVTGTGSQRVTIASDNTAFAVNATLTAETTKVIGVVRNLGNAGAILDFAGQNAASPANAWLTGCQFNTTPITITSTNASPLQCDNAGKMLVNTGTVTVTATNLSENIAQVNGQTVGAGAGATTTGTLRTTLASDSPGIVTLGANTVANSIPITVATDQSIIITSSRVCPPNPISKKISPLC